jgi:hypothetical protein
MERYEKWIESFLNWPKEVEPVNPDCYTKEEKAEIKARLKNFGYID